MPVAQRQADLQYQGVSLAVASTVNTVHTVCHLQVHNAQPYESAACSLLLDHCKPDELYMMHLPASRATWVWRWVLPGLNVLQDIVVQKGLGSWIWDTQGNKYLDMTAGAADNRRCPHAFNCFARRRLSQSYCKRAAEAAVW